MIISLLVLMLQSVLALESSVKVDNLMTEAGITPGTNPDAFSYKLGNFWEGISYSLTFNKGAKTQKGLQIARKHLWEVKVFSENNNLDKAQKAQGKYGAWISKVKANIESTSTDDPKEELEKNMQLNAELEKEDRLLEGVKSDIASSSRLSVEEKAKASKIVDKAVENKAEVKRTAEEKKEKAQTKFKARFGLKEKEMKEEVRKLESKSDVHRSSKKESHKEEQVENKTKTDPKEQDPKEHREERKEEIRKVEEKDTQEEKRTEKNEPSGLKERTERTKKEAKNKENSREEEPSKGDHERKSNED